MGESERGGERDEREFEKRGDEGRGESERVGERNERKEDKGRGERG